MEFGLKVSWLQSWASGLFLCVWRCKCAEIAQLVEQGTENPRVDGSIPPLGTTVEVNDNGTGV